MKITIIPEDLEYLKEKLSSLEAESRKLLKKLGEAAAHNGAFATKIPEYDSIREKVDAIDETANRVKKILANSNVTKFESIDKNIIDHYSLVTVMDPETKEEFSYYIIEPLLADRMSDISDLLIASPKSPVGSSLLGNKTGMTVTIDLPERKKKFKITEQKNKGSSIISQKVGFLVLFDLKIFPCRFFSLFEIYFL